MKSGEIQLRFDSFPRNVILKHSVRMYREKLLNIKTRQAVHKSC